MSDRVFLTMGEAAARLPDRDRIHTFRNPSCALMLGADWDRDQLLAALGRAPYIEETGPRAMASGYGLVILEGGSLLFIEAGGPPAEDEN